jgi:hypothetical protein
VTERERLSERLEAAEKEADGLREQLYTDERIYERMVAAEERAAALEEAVDRYVNWDEPRIIPTEGIPDKATALRVLRAVLGPGIA